MKLKFKIVFIVTAIMALASWLIAILYWDKLPSVIPIHFGFNGVADGWADKSIVSVFSIPMLQTCIWALFVFVYYKPQYSNMPSTMWLVALDENHKDYAYNLIRTMHAGISVLIGLIFTYIIYAINISAISSNSFMSTPFLFAIFGIMIVWLMFWTIKIYRIIKGFINKKA
jgi:uncharacterized membrane protein